MKIQSVLNDIEILVKMGQQEDAMTILKQFQKETLFEYRKWYQKNYEGEVIIHPYFIEKFNNKSE